MAASRLPWRFFGAVIDVEVYEQSKEFRVAAQA